MHYKYLIIVTTRDLVGRESFVWSTNM